METINIQERNNIKESYEKGFQDEEEELEAQEYLGTFRWKRSFKFILLPQTKMYDYSSNNIDNWNQYLQNRVDEDFQIEPHIIDALSYPLSIIHGLKYLKSENKLNLSDKVFNIILIGVSQKAEVRIALESNYFDEIFFYLNCEKNKSEKKSNLFEENLEVNLFFVGPEVKNSNSYISKLSTKMKYTFSSSKTGEFLKNYALDFNKTNTIAIGMNCGFGAGYLRLTNSWVDDLTKLLKLNYNLFFTYTNDYEDMVGELAIIGDLLGGKISKNIIDNPFKSMTTYKNDEDNLWSCGNYGIYFICGYIKEKILKIGKMKEDELKQTIKKILEDKGIRIK